MYEIYATNTNYTAILRTTDNTVIPIDAKNPDYKEYVVWANTAGNTPLAGIPLLTE